MKVNIKRTKVIPSQAKLASFLVECAIKGLAVILYSAPPVRNGSTNTAVKSEVIFQNAVDFVWPSCWSGQTSQGDMLAAGGGAETNSITRVKLEEILRLVAPPGFQGCLLKKKRSSYT